MVAIIPAYEPDEHLVQVASELNSLGFRIIVADDGSSPDKKEIFDKVKHCAIVLRHEKKPRKGSCAQNSNEIYS